MGERVEIKISRELAEWLREIVSGVADGLAGGVNRQVALEAIDFALQSHTRKPRSCAVCGGSLYVPGYGRPGKYCSNACRQRAYRDRVSQKSYRARKGV